MKMVRLMWLMLLFPALAGANLLSNGSFETPVGTTNFTGSGWQALGPAEPARDGWCARTSTSADYRGGYLTGWSGPSAGGIQQDVPVSPGTYTFSIWMRQEPGYSAVDNELRIEWYDSSDSLLDFTSAFYTMPGDNAWHQLRVTSTSTAVNVSYARIRYYVNWNSPGVGGSAAYFDDAEFYEGDARPSPLANGVFERPVSGLDDYWRAAVWHNQPTPPPYGFETWAARSGGWGVALWGWDVAALSNSVTFSQNASPNTNTVTFAIHLAREPDFFLSNAILRLEWFNADGVTKAQADTESPLSVPNDNAWHEYSITGTCLPDYYEVRASLFAEWWQNTNAGGSKALRIDDARLLPGAFDGSSIHEDGTYYNAAGFTPSVENVPGTNVGPFLQVDYASHTSTWYVITPADGFARYAPEGGIAGMRVSWQRPENGAYVTTFSDMEYVGSIVLSAGAPFHGWPSSGSVTQSLWRYRAEFPRDLNGDIYATNPITVFYSPYLRTTNEAGGETDRRYLVAQSGGSTNSLDQQFDEVPESRDYAFQLNPPAAAELQNPGFESPAASDFSGAKWNGFGAVGRETWAARRGDRGGYFVSWNAGSGGVFQDVAVTGGVQTFTLWMKRSLGAHPNKIEAKIEWFNTAAQLMFAETNLVALPADELWHRVYVTSTLPSGQATFARVVLFADFNAGSYPYHEVIDFDDAEFYSGGFTSVQELANAGFEAGGTGFAGAQWDGVVSDWVNRDTWAARTDAWGADFAGAATNQPAYTGSLSQGLNLSTGTYEFGVWILAEDSVLLTNAELRIRWLDADFASLQADSVAKLTLPLDNAWHYYAITGSCASAALFEVRPTIVAQWDRNEGPGSKAIKMDDAGFALLVSTDDDGDGLPNEWESRYFGSNTAADPAVDSDGDQALNWQEYVADTNPTNTASHFPNIITNASGQGVLTLLAGPPTTNSRVYDVWSNTNLAHGEWSPVGLSAAGRVDGLAVTLMVTNAAPARFYRTGVRIP